MSAPEDLLSEEEADILAEALALGEGRDLCHSEVEAFLNWARETRARFALLDMVLDCAFAARWDGRTFAFLFRPDRPAPAGQAPD